MLNMNDLESLLYAHIAPRPWRRMSGEYGKIPNEVMALSSERIVAKPTIGFTWPMTRQIKYLQRAMYLAWVHDDKYMQKLPFVRLNRKRVHQYSLQRSGDPQFQLILRGFFNFDSTYAASRMQILWDCTPSQNKAVRHLARLIYDAYGFQETSILPKYKTDTARGLLLRIRETEDFTAMPLVADALQDADYEDDHVLNHLRHSTIFSFGSFIFERFGIT